jgi:hypothetical protein
MKSTLIAAGAAMALSTVFAWAQPTTAPTPPAVTPPPVAAPPTACAASSGQPPAIPDGATAVKATMEAFVSATKGYQGEVQKHLACRKLEIDASRDDEAWYGNAFKSSLSDFNSYVAGVDAQIAIYNARTAKKSKKKGAEDAVTPPPAVPAPPPLSPVANPADRPTKCAAPPPKPAIPDGAKAKERDFKKGVEARATWMTAAGPLTECRRGEAMTATAVKTARVNEYNAVAIALQEFEKKANMQVNAFNARLPSR